MCNKMIKTSNGNFHKGFYESCKENYMKQLLNIRSNNPDAESKTYYSAEFFYMVYAIYLLMTYIKNSDMIY